MVIIGEQNQEKRLGFKLCVLTQSTFFFLPEQLYCSKTEISKWRFEYLILTEAGEATSSI